MKIKATICETRRYEVEFEVGDAMLMVDIEDAIHEHLTDDNTGKEPYFEETKIADIRLES